MAISSFVETLTIEDEKKISEIAHALKKPRDTSILPSQPPKMTADERSLWCKH